MSPVPDAGGAFKLGSAEVYEELGRRLAADTEWTDRGKDISCTMTFGFSAPVDSRIFLRFDQGQIEGVRALDPADEVEVDFAFTGSPDVWREVFAKQTSPSLALMTGKIKLVGKKSWLLANMTSFNYLLGVLTGIEQH